MNLQPKLNLKQINQEDFLKKYLKAHEVEDVNEYKWPTGKSLQPYTMYDQDAMHLGYTLLELNCNKKVGVIVDSDCDGMMSASMMINFLLSAYSHMDITPIIHSKKQHGLVEDGLVEKIIEERYDLIIIPDGGSNDVEQCKTLYDKDIQVLILDHHDIEEENPYAIIINNQLPSNDPEINRALSGAGVTYKFIEFVSAKNNWVEPDNYKDMVAVSIVSDICNITPENRYFLSNGLAGLINPCLLEMYYHFCEGAFPTPEDIGWKIAPKINAVTRGTDVKLKSRLVDALVTGICKDWSRLLKDLTNAHSRQTTITKKAAEKYRDMETEHGIAIIRDNELDSGYYGVSANRIMKQKQYPILIVDDHEGETIGSVRSPFKFKSMLNDCPHVKWAKGHEQACGVCFDTKDEEKVLKAFSKELLPEPTQDVALVFERPSQIPDWLYGVGDNHNTLWCNNIPFPDIGIKGIEILGSDIQEHGRYGTTIIFTYDDVKFKAIYISKVIRNQDMKVGQNRLMKWNVVGRPKFNAEYNERYIEIKEFEVEEVECVF